MSVLLSHFIRRLWFIKCYFNNHLPVFKIKAKYEEDKDQSLLVELFSVDTGYNEELCNALAHMLSIKR